MPIHREPVVALALLTSTALMSSPAAGVRLTPRAVAGWTAYVAGAESRLLREMAPGERFLGMDYHAEGAADRRAALAGGLPIREVDPPAAVGRDVPDALVHHWRGAVLLPGRRLADLLAAMHARAPARSDDVLESAVLARGPDWMRVFLRLQRTRFVTVVFNTEHLVSFRRFGAGRASMTSVSLRIAEVEQPGTAAERERPPGDDRGFLWRLNAYWRYEQVDGGVLAECESVSLSRDVPSLVRYLAMPMVRSAARESMERTLLALRREMTP